MKQKSFRPYGPAGHGRRRAIAPAAALVVLMTSAGALADLPVRIEAPVATASVNPSVRAPAEQASAPATDGAVALLFDPAPSLGPEVLDLSRNAPLAATFEWASARPEAAPEAP